MKQYGYDLIRQEIYNFGNFHNLNLVDYFQGKIVTNSNLHSLILGVNGAGKTTISDSYAVLLVPDERKLKLGMLSDVQKGKSPRTVADYILGKYLSNDETELTDPEKIFSRKNGISISLAVFKHRNNGKFMTLCRVWFFQNYKVKDESSYIVASCDLSVLDKNKTNLLTEIGAFYDSPRALIKGLKERLGNIILCGSTTQSDYISEINRSFGMDVEACLNHVQMATSKTVADIDEHIKTKMLPERENKGLDGLLLHLNQMKNITDNLDFAKDKLDRINDILEHAAKIKESFERTKELNKEIVLCDGIEKVNRKHQLEKSIATLKAKMLKASEEIPGLQKELLEAEKNLDHATSALNKLNLDGKLEMIEKDIKDKEVLKARAEQDLKQAQALSGRYGFIGLTEDTSRDEAVKSLKEAIKAIDTKKTELFDQASKLQAERLRIDAEIQKVRNEIVFLNSNKTMISSDQYAVKERAKTELGFGSNEITFFGENIRLKPGQEKYLHAVNAIFAGSAQNILVVPEKASMFDLWVNKTDFRTTQRVRELDQARIPFQPNVDSILSKIEVKEGTLFTEVLKANLMRYYDAQIVSPDEITNQSGFLVTEDGYVKKGKVKTKNVRKNICAIGWDNTGKIEELKKQYQAREASLAALDQSKTEIEKSRKSVEYDHLIFNTIEQSDISFLNLKSVKQQIETLEGHRSQLLNENPNLSRLKDDQRLYKSEVTRLNREIQQRNVHLEVDKTQLDTNDKALTDQANDFEEYYQQAGSLSGISLKGLYPTNEELETTITELKEKNNLKSQNAIIDHRNLLLEEIKGLGRGAADKLSRALNSYSKSRCYDPDLSYAIPMNSVETESFLVAWIDAQKKIVQTELPRVKEAWANCHQSISAEFVKQGVSDVNQQKAEIEGRLKNINGILKKTYFERLADGDKYLQIEHEPSKDTRILEFSSHTRRIARELSAGRIKSLDFEAQAQEVRSLLEPFHDLIKDESIRTFVVDARNHFKFSVQSFLKLSDGRVEAQEKFAGAKKDSKSQGQTNHIGCVLIAAALHYRLRFDDPHLGKNTIRSVIMDEFASVMDQSRAEEVIRTLSQLGFRLIMLTPLEKVDVIRPYCNAIVGVSKESTSTSCILMIEQEQLEAFKDKLKSEDVEYNSHEEVI